jgi:hypothetical protein
VGDGNNSFYFFGIAVLCLKKNVIRNRKACRAKAFIHSNSSLFNEFVCKLGFFLA